jgi:hypothetical protein
LLLTAVKIDPRFYRCAASVNDAERAIGGSLGEGAAMKRALVVTLAAVFASACVLTSAFADASFTDPAGDAADAPDVTGVAVSNDKGGNILFHVTLNNFTPESRLTIYLDTDKNASTGEEGADYLLALDHSADPAQSGWMMGQWNGTGWASAPQHATVAVSSNAAYAEFRVNKSELGGTSGFAFQVWTKRYVADAVTARDYAPDGPLSTWTYELTTPTAAPTPTPKPVVVKPVFGTLLMTLPVAGRRVTYSIHVNRSDTGAPLTTGTMICDPSIAGTVIKHAEQFKNGIATLTFVVPKTARGKMLKVKVKIATGTTSATKITTVPIF